MSAIPFVKMFSLMFVIFLLIIGVSLLLVGSNWFLDGAGDLARTFGISALVVGVRRAGLEPEEMLTAAIISARGAPALAVGNVVSTNITIVTAAPGLSALLFPVVIDRNPRLGACHRAPLSGRGYPIRGHTSSGHVCGIHVRALSDRSPGGQAHGKGGRR